MLLPVELRRWPSRRPAPLPNAASTLERQAAAFGGPTTLLAHLVGHFSRAVLAQTRSARSCLIRMIQRATRFMLGRVKPMRLVTLRPASGSTNLPIAATVGHSSLA